MPASHPATTPQTDVSALLHRGYQVIDHLPEPNSEQWHQYLAEIDWDHPDHETAGRDLLAVTRELLGALEAAAGRQFPAAS